MPVLTVGPYFKGHVRAKNKDHLQMLSGLKHGLQLRGEPDATEPEWDSVALGLVPPVKDQGQCGSCWDFSGTGVCEIAYIKAGAYKNDGSFALSEQYTLSCGRNGGCNGDDNVTVLEEAKKTGLPTTQDYGPYNARGGRCTYQQSMSLHKIDEWGFADPSGSQGEGVTDVQFIKNAIKKYGCVGAAIAADNAFMNAPANGVFDRTTSQEIDHDIILVGWQNTATKVTSAVTVGSASVTASNGNWKLRNSWGGKWCNGGYCRIGWGVNNVGTEAVWAFVNPLAPPIVIWG